jgi:hypothetical protein
VIYWTFRYPIHDVSNTPVLFKDKVKSFKQGRNRIEASKGTLSNRRRKYNSGKHIAETPILNTVDSLSIRSHTQRIFLLGTIPPIAKHLAEMLTLQGFKLVQSQSFL